MRSTFTVSLIRNQMSGHLLALKERTCVTHGNKVLYRGFLLFCQSYFYGFWTIGGMMSYRRILKSGFIYLCSTQNFYFWKKKRKEIHYIKASRQKTLFLVFIKLVLDDYITHALLLFFLSPRVSYFFTHPCHYTDTHTVIYLIFVQ